MKVGTPQDKHHIILTHHETGRLLFAAVASHCDRLLC